MIRAKIKTNEYLMTNWVILLITDGFFEIEGNGGSDF